MGLTPSNLHPRNILHALRLSVATSVAETSDNTGSRRLQSWARLDLKT